jgi:thiol-disulfide isomerase/thioredoxin
MLARWWTWWRRQGPRHEVVLYTRQGCHLCDEAHAVLEQAGQRWPLQIQTIDVDTDPALAQRYGLEVPVVTVDGVVRFRGRINRVLLERQLRAGG